MIANLIFQDIAPTYFDIDRLKDGDAKNALKRVRDKMRRHEAVKSDSQRARG
jgi:hypothetical protein